MTHEEMMALSKGDMVVTKTGVVYRVYRVERKGESHPAVRVERGVVVKYTAQYTHDMIDFKQQRNGEDHGPTRCLKPENIKRA